ncbi:MAG: DKNYY domain-containing protein [Flavobacteriaceae bacterium]|nr:DKNYY domain-containing protein [Flavobacteriaceae bacterium]
MAEAAGILFEIKISEANLKKILNKSVAIFLPDEYKIDEQEILGKQKLIYFFTSLLYSCENSSANIFLFNYEGEKLFCAYILNYYTDIILKPFEKLLTLFAQNKDIESKDTAIITSIYPDVEHGYSIEKGKLTKITNSKINNNVVQHLIDKMWSFRVKNDFPEPKKALRKRTYFYKPLKSAYKRYLKQIEEIEKPAKIARATKEDPYHLFDEFYAYDNKVFEISSYGTVEVPKADPLTFRCVTNRPPCFYADKNIVFEEKNEFEESIINEKPYFKHIKKYFKIIDGIDGSTFNYVKDRWETIFWKDKKHVFIYSKKRFLFFSIYGEEQLIRLNNADVKTFEQLSFGFGKDKNNIYYCGKIMDIDNKNYIINKNGFIYDDKNVYHFTNNLNLDGKTFKVIKYESETNPFLGVFILEDKNGQYEYEHTCEFTGFR